MKKLLIGACLSAALALGAACGGESTTIAATDSDGKKVEAKVDEKTGSVTVESADGKTQTGAGTKLPDGWPSGFPSPDGATLIGSHSANDGMWVYYQAPSKDVADFFKRELPKAGFKVEDTSQMSSGGYTASVLTFTGKGFKGTISIGQGAAQGQDGYAIGLEPMEDEPGSEDDRS